MVVYQASSTTDDLIVPFHVALDGMPEDAVESLLQQVSDEHGLQFASRAADASTAPVAMSAPTAAALQESQEDALEKRLAALRSVG